MNIDQVKKDGFLLHHTHKKIQDVSFVSLRSSLRAYFSTFKNINWSFRRVFAEGKEPDETDRAYGYSYIENACLSITSYHHFIELVLKDILTKTHPLLAIDASAKHGLLYDLIKGVEVDDSRIEEMKLLEFSFTLERIVALVKEGKIDRKFQFLVDAQPWLKVLNNLRNRIAHRGVFVIRYKALDHLFGKFALPFLREIIALPDYTKNKLWQPKELDISVDCIKEICDHFTSGRKYDPYKVGLLKEMARAAYENPMYFTKKGKDIIGIDRDTRKRAELLAKHICQEEYCEDAAECPVCGVRSLVLFNDSFDTFDDHGEQDGIATYIYKLSCFCCSFSLTNEGKMNFKKMGFTIRDYWARG